MDVSLSNKREGFVSRLIALGRYRSASAVVREGLRLLEIREAQLQSQSEPKKNSRLPKKSVTNVH